MGEDTPVELRPKYNFHIFDANTGEIVETLWDIQYAYAMERLTELQNIHSDDNLLDITSCTASSPEELTYTNIREYRGY